MKTVKSLSAVLALTVGMSAVAGVSALNFDWFEKASEPSNKQYFSFSWSKGTDLDAKISQLNKAWENKAEWQKNVKELTELRCDLLKEIAGTQFVYDNFDKLKGVVLVKTAQVDVTTHVNKKGAFVADNAVVVNVPADLKVSEKDLDALNAALKDLKAADAAADTEEKAKAKVNGLTINGKSIAMGSKTNGQVVIEAVNAVNELVKKFKSDEYKADVALIEKTATGKDELFKSLTTLNNELNKFDEFIALLPAELDAKIFVESCPIKFAGKLPIKDETKVEKKDEKEAAKDNVPNTAAAAATASVAFASIFAAAAAVVAKRK